MKEFILIGLLATTGSGFSQGTIIFMNRNIPKAFDLGTYNVPIYEYNPETGIQQNGAGALYSPDEFRIASSPLRTDPAPSLNSAFFAIASQTVAVPGWGPGTTPPLIIRAWQGRSYEEARADGMLYMAWSFTSKPLGGKPVDGGEAVLPPGMTGWGREDSAGFELSPPCRVQTQPFAT